MGRLSRTGERDESRGRSPDRANKEEKLRTQAAVGSSSVRTCQTLYLRKQRLGKAREGSALALTRPAVLHLHWVFAPAAFASQRADRGIGGVIGVPCLSSSTIAVIFSSRLFHIAASPTTHMHSHRAQHQPWPPDLIEPAAGLRRLFPVIATSPPPRWPMSLSLVPPAIG